MAFFFIFVLFLYRIQCFSAGLYGKQAGIFVKSFTPGRGPVFAIEYVPGGKQNLFYFSLYKCIPSNSEAISVIL